MDTLSIEQLEQIPWNTRYVVGPEVPPEPPINEIRKLVNIPFMKRKKKYPLFYSWSETIKCVGKKPCKVLDAACGRGIISQILFFKGHDVFACDIENYFIADNHIDFRRVDLNSSLPYADNYFDVVINCEGLQYLKHSSIFIEEAARVLKNKGNLILSIPNIHSIASRYNFFKTGQLSGYNVHVLSRQNITYLPYLSELLTVYNFRIIDIKGNIPQFGPKLKILDYFLGRFLFGDENEVIRFSHSLIINAEKNEL